MELRAHRDPRLVLAGLLVLVLATAGQAQEPIDLFPDAPRVGNGYIRVACWSLGHINLEGQVRDFLPGNNDDEDFAILIATFAKAMVVKATVATHGDRTVKGSIKSGPFDELCEKVASEINGRRGK